MWFILYRQKKSFFFIRFDVPKSSTISKITSHLRVVHGKTFFSGVSHIKRYRKDRFFLLLHLPPNRNNNQTLDLSVYVSTSVIYSLSVYAFTDDWIKIHNPMLNYIFCKRIKIVRSYVKFR